MFSTELEQQGSSVLSTTLQSTQEVEWGREAVEPESQVQIIALSMATYGLWSTHFLPEPQFPYLQNGNK